MVSVQQYGAVGNGIHNDTPAFIAAIAASKVFPAQPVFIPAGVYLITQTLVTGDFRGFVGEGKASSTILARPAPSASLNILIDATGMQRGTFRDFRVDCNNNVQVGIKTDYTSGGPSLNNAYLDLIIENYLVTGWQAHDNNDCYFERILISNSANNPNDPGLPNPTGALRSLAAGGPLQFINCNFLNDVFIAAQYINFTDCVTTGITVYGPGFNILSYVGGYAYPSFSDKNAVVFIAASGNAHNLPTEAGPITFTGSHIEINANQYLISTARATRGAQLLSGKLHYGVNAIGCHIAAAGNAGGGSLLSPVLSSAYFPFATSKFANCWFSQITMLEIVVSSTDNKGSFRLQYENCYSNSYYYNEPAYLNSRAGGDITGELGLPGTGEINGKANNFFKSGGQDGASYTRHNLVLQGHWGMALNGPNGVTNGFVDFRLGKIDLKQGYYINTKPALTLDHAGFPNISGLAEYSTNAAAVSALGVGKLYHTSGTVKITV